MVNGEDRSTFAMTDLAERLQGSEGAEIAATVLVRLESLQRAVDRKMGEGVSLGQLEPLQAITRSLAAARSIMIGIAPR